MTFPMMKIYLAARYSKAGLLTKLELDLNDLGFPVTSRWIHGRPPRTDQELIHGSEADQLFVHMRADAALEQLRATDLLIEFSDEPSSSGGRHFEAGFAAAIGVERWVVGPLENIFQATPPAKRFPDWTAAETELRAIATALTDDQLAVWSRVLQGMSPKEIGLELGLTPRAVHGRLERARWNWPDLPKRKDLR